MHLFSLFQLTLELANLDFQAGFGRSGHDADVFTVCVDIASTSLGSCRIAALSLFSNVVVGFNSATPKLISLHLLQKLLGVLDAAHAAGDVNTLCPNSEPQTP